MDEKVIEELNKVEQKIDFLCQKLQIIENILKQFLFIYCRLHNIENRQKDERKIIIPTIQVKGKI